MLISPGTPPGSDDLISDTVTTRFEVVGPELIDFPRYSRKRLFPTGLLLIDGAAVVDAQRVKETVDLDLGQPISHRAPDDGRRQLDLFVFSQARRFAQLFDQFSLFSFDRGLQTGVLFGLFGRLESGLSPDFLGRRQRIIDLLEHGSSLHLAS
jgi:hypothetical protein